MISIYCWMQLCKRDSMGRSFLPNHRVPVSILLRGTLHKFFLLWLRAKKSFVGGFVSGKLKQACHMYVCSCVYLCVCPCVVFVRHQYWQPVMVCLRPRKLVTWWKTVRQRIRVYKKELGWIRSTKVQDSFPVLATKKKARLRQNLNSELKVHEIALSSFLTCKRFCQFAAEQTATK